MLEWFVWEVGISGIHPHGFVAFRVEVQPIVGVFGSKKEPDRETLRQR